MEQGLVRFRRFVNDMEGDGQGQKYIELAKWLLDCRSTTAVQRSGRTDPSPTNGPEYDQSHLPVVQQYEVWRHRSARYVPRFRYGGTSAVETHDLEYHSAVKSLWDNLVNKKIYVTGGVRQRRYFRGLRRQLRAQQPGVFARPVRAAAKSSSIGECIWRITRPSTRTSSERDHVQRAAGR